MNFKRFIRKVKRRVIGAELSTFKLHRHLFTDRQGIEVGGPSFIFGNKQFLPVYKYARIVDGCNFSATTVWEGSILEGQHYAYTKGKLGYQHICEGNDLSGTPDNTYDFVLSSHNLEHFSNPLKAVAEWLRVLKPGGALLMVLPDKRFTFDHRREITPFAHLLEDYRQGITEHDLTHLEEILALHDYTMDPLSGGYENFRERSLKNFENRCLHHHVFDNALLQEIFSYFNIKTLFTDFAPPFHIIIMGQKAGEDQRLGTTLRNRSTAMPYK